MKIERYTGRDTREAMALVRAGLGSDAYILANRRVNGQVELTAAVDLDEVIAANEPRRSAAVDVRRSVVAPSGGDMQLKELENELHRLRGILETELGDRSWRDVAGQPAAQSTARQRLLRLGLSRSLAGQLLERAPRDGSVEQLWRLALAGLGRRLKSMPPQDSPSAVTAIYGGTGVGKTSTIAKLAGRDLQRFGIDGVALITVDSYRIGAQEQLASFADALGLPLIPARDARELAGAIESLRGRRIYIDTAGMSQRDARLHGQWSLVRQACPEACHLLTIAASAQPAQSRSIAAAFGSRSLSGAIITKVDEAHSLGGVIDVLLGSGLAVHSVCDGQRVPDDLAPMDATALLAKAVALAGIGQSDHRRATMPGMARATA